MFGAIGLLFRAYRIWVAGIAGYLVGAVLAADVASRVASRFGGERVDIRSVGSGNPGAGNVFGNMGLGWGAAVLAGDFVKGVASARAGRAIGGDAGAYAAGIGAVVGHCFPAFAEFRGGKGVATRSGTAVVCAPALVPVDAAALGLTFAKSRHPGVAAGVASGVFTVASVLWWLRRRRASSHAKASVWLPIYAIATSALILSRFVTPRPTGEK